MMEFMLFEEKRKLCKSMVDVVSTLSILHWKHITGCSTGAFKWSLSNLNKCE